MKDDRSFEESLKEALSKAEGFFGELGKPRIVGLDDEFEFECQQCGACCMNRNDIILNAYDIYTAARFLNISTYDFIDKFTTHTIGGYSKMPIIVLKPNEDDHCCPFLKLDYMDDGKYVCTIHPAKPGPCRNHPLGVVAACDVKSGSPEYTPAETKFILVENCKQSHQPVKHKVREWAKYYLDHKDEFDAAHALSVAIGDLIDWRGLFAVSALFSAAVLSKHKKIEDDMLLYGMRLIVAAATDLAYASFDINKPFVPQAKKNLADVQKVLSDMNKGIVNPTTRIFDMICHKSLKEILDEAEDAVLEDVVYKAATHKDTHLDQYHVISTKEFEDIVQRAKGERNGNRKDKS